MSLGPDILALAVSPSTVPSSESRTLIKLPDEGTYL